MAAGITRLTHQDLEALLSATGQLYAATEPNLLLHAMLRIIARLIDLDVVTYDEVNAHTGEVALRQYPETPGVIEVLPALTACLHTHPVIPTFHARNPAPVKVSDFATLNQFRGTAVFNEVYRQLGVQHQMTHFPQIPHRADTLGSSFTLSRFRLDFSERDRQVLAHLAPHFRQAYINAVALQGFRTREDLLIHACAATRQEVVFLTAQQQVAAMSSRAAAWLAEYFCAGKRTTGLPDELRNWLTDQPRDRSGGVAAPRTPLVVSKGDKRLIVRWYDEPGGEQMLLLSEQQPFFAHERLERLGLTRRESEVMRWIAEGKTDAEIGVIIGASPHTAHKHAQNIFAKLDAHTRSAAVLRVFELPTE